MKSARQIRIFFTFLVSVASVGLFGQEGGSDAISYQVPRYTDSRLFFTRKMKNLPLAFVAEGDFYQIQHSPWMGKKIEYKFRKHNLRSLISPAAFRNKCADNKIVKIAAGFSSLKGKMSALKTENDAGSAAKEKKEAILLKQYKDEIELFKKSVQGFDNSREKTREVIVNERPVRTNNAINKILKEIDSLSAEEGKSNVELIEKRSKEIEALIRTKYGKSECQAVESGESISLIVNRLRLPELNSFFKVSRLKDDVAAVVDVDTGSQKKTPVIVKYVRDAENFSTMDFGDLTVFSDSSWSGLVAPYFRFRLIDVATDDNEDVKKFLTRSATVVGKLSTVAVDPVIAPLVQVGIEGARMLIGNDDNSPIIDYEFQLYTKQMIDRSGADNYLGQLKPGLAVLFARDSSVASDNKDIQEFWNQEFYVDVETGFVFWIEEEGEKDQKVRIVNSPTIIATISTAELGIPSIITDRTRELQEKLVRSNDGMVSQDLENIGAQLDSALKIHSARIKLRRYPNNKVACEAYAVFKKSSDVTLEQRMMLLRTINEYFMRDELMPDLSAEGRLNELCSNTATSQNLLRYPDSSRESQNRPFAPGSMMPTLELLAGIP